jgi:hypothetical protein
MTRVRSTSWNFWRLWLPTFLGFPLGGLLTSLTVGPIQTPLESLLGGLLGGAVIGLVQWLALRFTFGLSANWIWATSVGMAVGLALAVTFFGNDARTIPLLARALITGFSVGVAQAVVLRKTLNPFLWTTAITLLWPLAWFITSAVIRQNLGNDYAIFGSSGAIVFTVLSGLFLRLGKGALR